MSDWLSYSFLVYAVGFTAQILFSARLLIQWLKSERVKTVLTPVLFWELSLLASFLLFVYGWMRDDFAIMLGQSITYFIYIRNMQLQGTWKKLSVLLRSFFLLFPAMLIWYSYHNNRIDVNLLLHNKDIPMMLLLWGSAGQIIFTFRFIYQCIYSEKRKESSLPLGFWIISLTGSIMILSYAVFRKDPVLFAGQVFGFIVYIRNIVLLVKSKRKKPQKNER
jgi:lipid-A-disaccharide synthase-like uncharacterized protein